jgi:proline racemase
VHGTIGTVMMLLEMGMVEAKEPETVVIFDTPAGLVKAHAVVEHGKACRVWIENVPAFLLKADVPIEVEDLGVVTVDIAFGGNFFALISSDQIGVPLEPRRIKNLVDIGLRVRDAANQQVPVEHPIEEHINKVELTEITGPAVHPEAPACNITIFGEGSVDRSPCGTGTCARMAEMYAKGQLKPQSPPAACTERWKAIARFGLSHSEMSWS